MGISPFFRLLQSPVYLFTALVVGLFLFPLLIFSTDLSSNSFATRAYGFSIFAFIGFWGHVIGNLVEDNQHRMLTWTLPHFRKRLMAWATSVGLLSVSAWTALLIFASWDASEPAIFCVNLGLYGLGFAMSGGWDLITHRLYRGIIAALGLAVAWQWRALLAFGQQQIPWLAVIAFAIAIGAFCWVFNHRAFRMKPFAVFFSMLTAFYLSPREMVQKNIAKTRKASAKMWHLDLIGTGIVNWLRAGQYENYGWRTRNGLSPMFSAALILPMWVIFMTSGLNVFQYDFEAVLKMIYQVAFHFDQLKSKTAIQVSISVFFALMMYFLMRFSSFSLQRGHVYPLSRNRQMWIRYCGLLVENVSLPSAIYICES